VHEQGYTQPTPIQAGAIPAILAGKNLIGLAQTGTGKTAAFVLPLLQLLMNGKRGGVRALIVTPTRELAEQVNDSVKAFSKGSGLRSTTIYGGVGMGPQEQALRAGVDIIVACPGRLLDHLKQGTAVVNKLEILVLDEADRMLDMGFLPDIRRLLAQLPTQRQSLLFSATMSSEIKALTSEAAPNAQIVQIGQVLPAHTVTHAIYPVTPHLKTKLLMELLRRTDTESVLIFTRTKHRANRLHQQISRAGYKSAALHANRSQNQRQIAIDGFRDGTFQILVATDIAARGIDVERISHVINFDIPDTTDAYIHRIGRTGRAARSGDAFTIVTPEDAATVRAIEKAIGQPLERRTLNGFDYDAPAAEPDQFQRPPRQPMPARSHNAAPPQRTQAQRNQSRAEPARAKQRSPRSR
jgi:ATP-dependent RNA helicase RhlE